MPSNVSPSGSPCLISAKVSTPGHGQFRLTVAALSNAYICQLAPTLNRGILTVRRGVSNEDDHAGGFATPLELGETCGHGGSHCLGAITTTSS